MKESIVTFLEAFGEYRCDRHSSQRAFHAKAAAGVARPRAHLAAAAYLQREQIGVGKQRSSFGADLRYHQHAIFEPGDRAHCASRNAVVAGRREREPAEKPCTRVAAGQSVFFQGGPRVCGRRARAAPLMQARGRAPM